MSKSFAKMSPVEQERATAHKAAGKCVAGSYTCQNPSVKGGECAYHQSLQQNRTPRRLKMEELAERFFPEIYVVYKTRAHSAFVFKSWKTAGGTQEQLDFLDAEARKL